MSDDRLVGRARAMIYYQLTQNACAICRGEENPTFCDINGICKITQTQPDDPEMCMDAGSENEWVIAGWEEITGISMHEKREKIQDKQKKIYYLPTLEKLESWVKAQDWKTAPLDFKEFFRRLLIFHRAYVGFMMEQ